MEMWQYFKEKKEKEKDRPPEGKSLLFTIRVRSYQKAPKRVKDSLHKPLLFRDD